jgi:hypothetical protein
MANPFPFVAGDVLTAAELNGIGESTAYTPTFTNITVGNGTVAFKFVQVQKLVLVQGTLTFGSTTSISGQPHMTLPVTSASYAASTGWGLARFFDSPSVALFGLTQFFDTSNAGIRIYSVTGSSITNGVINATTPWTWTTGDTISVQFVYEAA